MKYLLSIALTAMAVVCAQPASAQQQTDVAFARGQTSATFNGRITGNADRRYIVNARAGQIMTVTFRPNKASAYFNVTAPGADSAMFIGSTSGNRFSMPLSVSGRHVVQVYLMRNAARRGESAAYTITISVTGRAGMAPPRPGQDALVPGTDYSATASIPCITSVGAGRRTCAAGVMRMPMGEATVDIKSADGGRRYMYFKNGRPTGSDARAPMQSSRRGDWNIIRIGRSEVYEIPDAFVVGG